MEIDFDTVNAAVGHLAVMVESGSGFQDTDEVIGDASYFIEVNQSGTGSMVRFRKGEWVIQLHTSQGAGVTPLVELAGLESLALTIAERL